MFYKKNDYDGKQNYIEDFSSSNLNSFTMNRYQSGCPPIQAQ